MATVSAKVYEHHKKTDGTYNVKICVHHKSERKFIDTNHYVVKKQLTKGFKIKAPFVVEKVDRQLREYRKIISELDDRLIYFTAESLRDFLRDKDEDIDFAKFCDNYISRLRKERRTRSADNHRVVRNYYANWVKPTCLRAFVALGYCQPKNSLFGLKLFSRMPKSIRYSMRE